MRSVSDVAGFMDFMDDVLRALTLSDVILVGASFVGWVAAELAASRTALCR